MMPVNKRCRAVRLKRERDPWLKPCEVARLLGVSESTVSRWIKRGLIVARYTATGRPMVRRSDARLMG